MNYKIEKMGEFTVIGFEKIINNKTAFKDCPAFWGEFTKSYMQPIMKKGKPETEIEKAVFDNCIGEYGVCVCEGNDNFRYIIAGQYKGGEVPDGMTLYTFPDLDWVKFTTKGAMPKAIQELNNQIFSEFMPSHPEIELATIANIEWYSQGDTNSADYESGILIPVKINN